MATRHDAPTRHDDAMETTGGRTSEQLKVEAEELVLDSFTAGDAVDLGLDAVRIAQESNLPIVIEVRRLGQVAFRAALEGSRRDSDGWIVRKARVVERFEDSTLAIRVKYEERGTTFNVSTGLSELEYAAHGGGVPISVRSVGIVGALYVSGLPQVDDHDFAVARIAELKAR